MTASGKLKTAAWLYLVMGLAGVASFIDIGVGSGPFGFPNLTPGFAIVLGLGLLARFDLVRSAAVVLSAVGTLFGIVAIAVWAADGEMSFGYEGTDGTVFEITKENAIYLNPSATALQRVLWLPAIAWLLSCPWQFTVLRSAAVKALTAPQKTGDPTPPPQTPPA
jgi:hypothetical protein